MEIPRGRGVLKVEISQGGRGYPGSSLSWGETYARKEFEMIDAKKEVLTYLRSFVKKEIEFLFTEMWFTSLA